MQFHHLGLVAKEIQAGKNQLEDLLGPLQWTEIFSDSIQKVDVCFCKDHSGVRYELVVPTQFSSPVWSAMQTRNNILNHIAYLVGNINVEEERLRKNRHVPLGTANPAVAFDNALIQFFLNPMGFIVELIERQSESTQVR